MQCGDESQPIVTAVAPVEVFFEGHKSDTELPGNEASLLIVRNK